MNKNYILDGKTVIVEPDFMKWAKWFETAHRIVKKTTLPDGVEISTVFLGIDHRFMDGPPILFETMVFGGEHDEYQRRYSTWDEAEEGHQETIQMIFNVTQ